MSTAVTVGYVYWTIRGGYLLASVMSSLPAWKLIDPLPVLAFIARRSSEKAKKPEDEETLETMLK